MDKYFNFYYQIKAPSTLLYYFSSGKHCSYLGNIEGNLVRANNVLLTIS